VGNGFADLPSDFDSVPPWKSNVQQDQVELVLLSFSNGFPSIRCFAGYLYTGSLLKSRTDDTSPRFVIINYKNSD
jgi:hypothetical protein